MGIVPTSSAFEYSTSMIQVAIYCVNGIIYIVYVGTKKEMDKLEALYLEGKYTPVSSSPVQLDQFNSPPPSLESQNENQPTKSERGRCNKLHACSAT